jgi:hypothetical protein
MEQGKYRIFLITLLEDVCRHETRWKLRIKQTKQGK